MKNVFMLLFCFLAINLGFAQCNEVMTANQDQDFFRATSLVDYSTIQTSKSLSQIANAPFQNAKITVNGVSTIVLARFNPLSSELQIKSGVKVYDIVKKNDLEILFTATNERFKTIAYLNENDEITTDYFVVDVGSKPNELLKKVTYKHERAKMSNNSYGINKPAKLKKIERYYIIDDSNKLVSLSIKKKSILKDFSQNAELILAYIKENKLKNNEDNLVLLANYITSLEADKNYGTSLASNKP